MIIDEKSPDGRRVVTEVPEHIVEIYGDGFGPSVMGFPSSKLTIFQMSFGEQDNDTTQYRKVVASISIPTVAILELADGIRQGFAKNKDALSKQIRATEEKMGL